MGCNRPAVGLCCFVLLVYLIQSLNHKCAREKTSTRTHAAVYTFGPRCFAILPIDFNQTKWVVRSFAPFRSVRSMPFCLESYSIASSKSRRRADFCGQLHKRFSETAINTPKPFIRIYIYAMEPITIFTMIYHKPTEMHWVLASKRIQRSNL